MKRYLGILARMLTIAVLVWSVSIVLVGSAINSGAAIIMFGAAMFFAVLLATAEWLKPTGS